MRAPWEMPEMVAWGESQSSVTALDVAPVETESWPRRGGPEVGFHLQRAADLHL
jgi:hypothetical protein